MAKAERSKTLSLADASFGFINPSFGEPETCTPKFKGSPKEPNIFLAKTPNEISKVYNKLLVTVGKWNADMYLKIQKGLNKHTETELPPGCPGFLDTIRSKKCEFGKIDEHRRASDSTAYKRAHKDCKPKKVFEIFPIEEPVFSREPSYKNLFKNAKNSRKPREREKLVLLETDISPMAPQIHDTSSSSMLCEPPSSRKFCELMPDGINNYLLEVRERRKSTKKKNSQELSKAEGRQDTISALFQEIPIKNVLYEQLTDQIELTKAVIGERLTKVDAEDELKGFSYMTNSMLGAEYQIEEFQDRFNDGKWRRKFDPDKMEQSDEGDTTDVSEVYISDSSSLCSGDSLETSIDGKNRRPKPSRIPYIEEVRRKRDSCYDKISMKWEKVVKKNLIEPNLRLTPIFRSLYTDVRLRSDERFYNNILQSLNAKFEDMYPKTFVPYRHRLSDWIKKEIQKDVNATEVTARRRFFESANIIEKSPPAEPKVIDYTPTRHLTNNQRIRLKCIMKDVENRQKEGMTDWRKQAFVEEYVNLHPIISIKGKPKMMTRSPKKMRSIVVASKAGTSRTMKDFRQPSLAESSIYFDSSSRFGAPPPTAEAPKHVMIL